LGGLLVSTIFTLAFVPTLFSLMMDVRQGTMRLLGRKDNQDADLVHPEEEVPEVVTS
jgi:hypothetical protein